MGELGLNKILGALLATALGLMALHQLSAIVFNHGGEGHHGEEQAEATSLSEQMCAKYAYCVAVADSGGGGEAEEEVFDLGAALAAADPSKGERVFKAQCTTCHNITDGGANGTGPNLHGVVGASKAAHPGFTYSAALSGLGGSWTYEDLNHWLNNPGAFARGTSMSFAGLRRDTDRANVIAYLAANSPGAPAFPAPMEASSDEAAPAEAAPTETVTEAVTEDADAATETDEQTFTEDAPTPTDEENE
ncbi:MAG: cytochrome c family protein [Hyphomonas oceanitis]|uniref:c-type cytochrome n=1 Tax=Hyphomonas oceanitis TaxID=81033 RepID=UPI00300136B0